MKEVYVNGSNKSKIKIPVLTISPTDLEFHQPSSLLRARRFVSLPPIDISSADSGLSSGSDSGAEASMPEEEMPQNMDSESIQSQGMMMECSDEEETYQPTGLVNTQSIQHDGFVREKDHEVMMQE